MTTRFAASRRGEVRRVLGVELGLRPGRWDEREGLWGSRIGCLDRLTDEVPRVLGSEGSGGAQIRGKGVP